MRISDWSSDVCSSDLPVLTGCRLPQRGQNKSSPKSYAKGEQIENLCDPPQPGWHTKRSKSVRHLMFGIPGVAAGKVDVFPTERRDGLRKSIRNVSRSEERRVGKKWCREWRLGW